MNYQDLFDNTDYRSFVKATTPKTAEHRANISKAQIGREVTDTQRAKISEALKGHKGYWEGKTFSAEHRAKMSAKAQGRGKKIQTPLGVFDSKKKAAEAYNTHLNKMLHWLKTKPTEFYYVNKGE